MRAGHSYIFSDGANDFVLAGINKHPFRSFIGLEFY
jgi:hypothetical protein